MIDSGRCMPFHLFFLEVVSTFEVMDICCGGLASNLFRPLQKKNGRQTTSLRFLKRTKSFLLLLLWVFCCCAAVWFIHTIGIFKWEIGPFIHAKHFLLFCQLFFSVCWMYPCVCVWGGEQQLHVQTFAYSLIRAQILSYSYTRGLTHTHNGG